MSLQFILGNSGSGKTEYMYKQVVLEAGENPTKDYLVIVPEQFTLQTQKKLVELSPNKAIMNIDVLSFNRLAYRVFDELGIVEKEILEETGKNLVLRKIAKEKEEELSVLRPNLNRMGYINEVKSLISEFVQYNVTSNQLWGHIRSGKLPSVLEAKLKDVAVMYEGFEEYMQGRYVTAEEVLNVLTYVAKDSKIIRDSVMVFDEFTGFTPIQLSLIKELMPLTKKMIVTLTIDGKEDFYHSNGMHELFDMPKKTIKTLCQMANFLHIDMLEPVVFADASKKRFIESSELAFMEENLFRRKIKAYDERTKDISIYELKNPKEEMLYVAREINRLVREEGYRYKEIAVVSGAVETYGNYVKSIFGKYHIPYFLDQTKEVIFHPFIEFIRATLEIVTHDFSHESVFRFLRCGFVDIEEEDIDLLENYILSTGIRGKKCWENRFLRVPRNKSLLVGEKDLDFVEGLRKQIFDLLEPVVDTFSKDEEGNYATVLEQCMSIYQMVVTLDVEQKLAKKEEEYLLQNEQVKAKEYEQIYRIVIELLDKFVTLLGDERMDVESFSEVLDAGFEAAKVASVPPGFDSVIIGDIERTRLNGIKVLFFVGVNDGTVPKTAGRGGILSQYERIMLKEMDIELAPGAREQVFIQKFYLYLNMTKPSKKLYLSYADVDADGKTLRPSYLIGVMKHLFPQISEKKLFELEKEVNWSTFDAAMDYFIHGQKDEKWYALAKVFLEQDKEKAEELLQASYMHYTDEPISKIVAEAIYGNKIEGSVTRLEKYAKCAYAHFLEYGLLLKERDICGFESMDIGNIYHDALKRYSQKLEQSEFDWFKVTDEIRDDFAKVAFHEAIEAYPSLAFYATAENEYRMKRMEHVFVQTVWALTKQVRKGRFVPEVFEISFSSHDKLDALSFALSEGKCMEILGRIDRVDTCQEDGKIYVKVIDYKSGKTTFDLLKIYQGTQLQLAVYMNAVEEIQKKKHPNLEAVTGGLLYYHIDDPVIEVAEGLSEAEINQKIFEALKPDGVVNSEERVYRAMDDEFEGKSDVIPVALKKDGSLAKSGTSVASSEEFAIIKDYVKMHMKRVGNEIYEGKVSTNPIPDGCNYCPYESICGISCKLPGFETKKVKVPDKDEIYSEMEKEIALWAK